MRGNLYLEREDYSLGEYDSGCCLNCSDAEEGCLCFDCKCKRCSWYVIPEDWDGEKGKCGKIFFLKKQRENESKEWWISHFSKKKGKKRQRSLGEFEKNAK